jgi:hypothetical protein
MFTNTLLGIPYFFLGILCLGVATVYIFIRPKPKPEQTRPMWQQVVLRWFHSLVWVLLAAACFLWTGNMDSTLAPFLGRLALFVYLIFLATVARERRTRSSS